ncbi:MAG TPA: TetR/AcrR family transcriptional regulator [Polyangia bacterium]|jgi:AcrR family transcriptional regulator
MATEHDRRERILEAAREDFLAHSYDGATLRAIAAAAQVTTGSLYHHFAGKDELFVEVCLEGMRRLVQRFRTAVELSQGRPLPERLVMLFDAYAAFFVEERGYYELIERLDRSREELAITPALGRRVDAVGNEIFATLFGLIREASPRLDDEAVRVKALTLLAVAEGLFSCQRRGLLGRFGLSLGTFRSRLPVDSLLKG